MRRISARWPCPVRCVADVAPRFIRSVLAGLVVLTPLVMSTWFALCPEYGNPGCPGGNVSTVLHAYRTAPPPLMQIFLVANFAAPYIYPLSYLALGLIALRRSTWLATFGLLTGWIGSVPFGYFADESSLLAAMARLHFDSQFAALVAEYMRDPHLLVVAAGWVIGHLLGYVLLGAALLRSDLVPRWSGAFLIAAAVVMGPIAYGTGLGLLQVIGYLLVTAASVPIAGVLLAGGAEPERGVAGRPS